MPNAATTEATSPRRTGVLSWDEAAGTEDLRRTPAGQNERSGS
jgi:hypothetical protein